MCPDCPLLKKGHPPVLPIRQNNKPLLIACAEGPGAIEEQLEEYLVGPTGRFFNKILGQLGVKRRDIYVTNAVMCRHREKLSAKEWGQAIKCCRPRLETELTSVDTKWVLAMGGKSLTAFTGRRTIRNWAGGPLPSTIGDRTVIPTFHPAWVQKPEGIAYKRVFKYHVRRALRFAQGTLKPWKWSRHILEPGKDAVEALTAMLKAKKPLGFDVENIPHAGIIMAVGIGNEDVVVSLPWHRYFAKGSHEVTPLEDRPYGKQCKRLVRKLLESNIPKIMHNGQHDTSVMAKEGITIKGELFDTMHAWTVVGRNTMKRLSMVACILTQAERWKDLFAEGSDAKGAEAFANRMELVLRAYNAKDTDMMNPLFVIISDLLDKHHKGWEEYRGKMLLEGIATKMYRTGAQIDTTNFTPLRRSLRRRMLKARRELQVIAAEFEMEDFNPNASKQKQELFFKHLGVTPLKYSELTGEPSIDKKVQEKLVVHSSKMVRLAARALMRYSRWKKLEDVLRLMPLDDVNVVHGCWDPSGAKTGRWSCTGEDNKGLNLMNLPTPKVKFVRDRKTKKFRTRVVVPGLRGIFTAFNNGWVSESDYSALELRLMTLFADDIRWTQWFAQGDDVHLRNTCELLKVKPESVSKTLRHTIKTLTFGSLYGAGPKTVHQIMAAALAPLGITPPSLTETELIHKRLYALHPNIRDFQLKMIRFAEENDYIEKPLTGHRIYFNGLVEPTKPPNYFVQGTGIDILNMKIHKVTEELRWNEDSEPEESLVAQVHDSLVIQGQDPWRIVDIPQRHMPYTMHYDGRSIEIPIETKLGPSWGDNRDVTTQEDVKRVLKEYAIAARASS